jgi:hypothetical protein
MHYKGKAFPKPSGKKSMFNDFQELFAYWNHVCRWITYIIFLIHSVQILLPVFCFEFLLENNCRTFIFLMYSPNFIISGIACLESFRSINAEPPWRKLKETLGFLFPILSHKFTMKLAQNQIIIISYILWWLDTNIMGASFGILFIFSNL